MDEFEEIKVEKEKKKQKEDSLCSIASSVIIIFLLFILLELFIIFIAEKISNGNLIIEGFQNYSQKYRKDNRFTDLFLRFAPLSKRKQRFKIKLTGERKLSVSNIDVSYHYMMNMTESFYIGNKKAKDIVESDIQADLEFTDNNLTSSSILIFDDYVQGYDAFHLNLLINGDVSEIERYNIFYSYTNPNLIKFIEILSFIIIYCVLISLYSYLRTKNKNSNVYSYIFVMDFCILIYVNPLGIVSSRFQTKTAYIISYLLFQIVYRNTIYYLLKTLVPPQKDAKLISKLQKMCDILLRVISFVQPLLTFFLTTEKDNMLFIRFEYTPNNAYSLYCYYSDFAYYLILFCFIISSIFSSTSLSNDNKKKNQSNSFILSCYFVLFFIEFIASFCSFFFLKYLDNNIFTSFICNVTKQTTEIFCALLLLFLKRIPNTSDYINL